MKFSPTYVTTLTTIPAWIIMGFGWYGRDPYAFAIGAVLLLTLFLGSIDARLRTLGGAPAR